jgi:hypothetical protein
LNTERHRILANQPLPDGRFCRRSRIESLHECPEALASIETRGCARLFRHTVPA